MKWYKFFKIYLGIGIFFTLSVLVNLPSINLNILPNILFTVLFLYLGIISRKKFYSDNELVEQQRIKQEQAIQRKNVKQEQAIQERNSSRILNTDNMTREEFNAYVDSQFPETIDNYNRTNVYLFEISGSQHHNIRAIYKLKQWDTLILKHISDNEYDSRAIAVLTSNNKQIGWIPSKSTYKDTIYNKLKRNEPVPAKFYSIREFTPYNEDIEIPIVKIAIGWYSE